MPLVNIGLLETKVNKYATVIVDKNHYSVPVSYVRLKVRVELSIDRVDIFHDGRKIAGHKRLFGNNKWQLDPQHYLELVRRKPGAFDGRLVREMAERTYIKEKRNIIFVGKTGTGKSHLATALGLEACRQGIRTRFVTGAGLVNEAYGHGFKVLYTPP